MCIPGRKDMLFDVILPCFATRSSWQIGSEFVFHDQGYNIGKHETVLVFQGHRYKLLLGK
jgi:hypothetical protein